MINYNVLYHIMFNAATDALRHCEELYIESEQ